MTATVEVPRDRYGRPLIQPAAGGKPVAYDRASSFGDVLEDKYHLSKWQQRMVAKGLTARPDLYLAASTTPLVEKSKLDRIAEQAIEAAGGTAKSTIGTSLHALTEYIDRGEDLPPYPAEYAKDLDAYREITARFEHVHIEQFMVCDQLKVAGTPDRLSRSAFDTLHDGSMFVYDLKTNGNANFLDKYASQLAIYSRSVLYDPATGGRTPVDLDQHVGWIVHMPQGEGRCDLYRVDLEAGWQAALLAAEVRAYRKKKHLVVPA